LYQRWEANTFTVKFDLNGKGSQTIDPISGVNEALSAEGGLKKALKNLTAVAEVPVGDNEDELVYEFMNWADNADGSGSIIGDSTPLFPKSAIDINNKEVTLYAPWRVKGAAQYRFNYKGTNGTDGIVQTWVVPVAGVYKIEAVGAGGNGGGLGGYIGGNIALEAGQALYIYVGGQGRPSGSWLGKSPRAGGWNGGGLSGGTSGDQVTIGGGGHGATDVRMKPGNWDDPDSLNSRIIVAGGGGGVGTLGYAGNGGLGNVAGGNGGYDGVDAVVTAGGGELTETGGQPSVTISRVTAGGFGKGGNGGSQHRGGGGGGSGYYGGSGGSTARPAQPEPPGGYVSGGGGGSSWARTSGDSLKFISNTIVPGSAGIGGGTNDGHGNVLITFVSAVEKNIE
jgi:hypothetical protein